MAKIDFVNALKTAQLERDIEQVYNNGISLYFPNVDIEHPFACDGLITTKEGEKLLKLIIEYKFDENFISKYARAKVITQVIYYIKQIENAGMILPNVVLVGDKNECFCFHTNCIIKYLDFDCDWSIAPSRAGLVNMDMVNAITEDSEVNPFVFDIREGFDFENVVEKIKELACNVQRYVHITEHNIATIYETFLNRVVRNQKKLSSHDLVGVFMGVITNGDEYYKHPTKKNLLVTPKKNVEIDSSAFDAFFSYFQRTYTPQEKNNFAAIADRLIEDTDRRNSGDYFTPTKYTDFAHKMISEQLGENWKDEYVVWDNCCYDDKTKVFTKQGWKLFSELNDDDVIYSLNPFTMVSEWVGFSKRQIIPYNGELLHFENTFIDLMVTPNHKMFNVFVNRDLKRCKTPRMNFFWSAEDTFNFISRRNNINEIVSSKLDIDDGNDYDFTIGKFIGFYLGDGYTQYLKDVPYAINIQVSKERKIDYIEKMIDEIGLDVTRTYVKRNDGVRKDSILFNIKFSKNDIEFIKPYIGNKAKDKCIPLSEFDKMSRNKMKGIIDGLLNSDAHKNETKRDIESFRFATHSEQLMRDVERLCIYVGYHSKCHAWNRADRNSIEYEVHICKEKETTYLTSKHLSKEQYNGFVYDVTLNKNHILLVERNGKKCFSGNCGTGNLTRDYRFGELYCSTLFDSELEIGKRYNQEATKFQFDFLNDYFPMKGDLHKADSKVPAGLIKALEEDKPIVFFLNPPYGKSTGAGGKISSGVSDTEVKKQMQKEKIEGSELLKQFLYRITKIKQSYNLTNCYIACFTSPSWLIKPQSKQFRKLFLSEFEYLNGIMFCASEFADCADNWGITFNIWKNGKQTDKNNFLHTLTRRNESGEVEIFDTKVLYNFDDSNVMTTTEYINGANKGKAKRNREIVVCKDIKTMQYEKITANVYDDYICCVKNCGNDVQPNQFTCITDVQPFGVGGRLQLTKSNILESCVSLAIRRLVSDEWTIHNDMYDMNHEIPNSFKLDCLVWSIFASYCCGINIEGGRLNNEFFFMSKSDMEVLANENGNDVCYIGAHTSDERFVYSYLQAHRNELSAEALQVLEKAEELVRVSFKYRAMFDEEKPEYQINNWDAGWYQIKGLLKMYCPDELKGFQELYKALSDKMRPMVYELGFLKK